MVETTPILYLAWQDATSRRWYPVGRLRRLPDKRYEFVYIRGYEFAREQAGMQPIIGFSESAQRYLSDTLFPHFQNRVMQKSREDYPLYLERLGFHEAPQDPLEILARSGGRKPTDSFAFQLFPAPSQVITETGERRYEIRFFIHGMRYMPEMARERALKAIVGKKLFLLGEWNNPHDPHAIMIRSEDNDLFGWVPRFYCADLIELRRLGQSIEATVAHVNTAPTPSWLQVMCKISAPWPEGFKALSTPEYELLAPSTDR